MESFIDLLNKELRKNGLLPANTEGARPEEASDALAQRLTGDPKVQQQILDIAARLNAALPPNPARVVQAYSDAAKLTDPSPPEVDEQA